MSKKDEANQLGQILRTTIKHYGLESNDLTMTQVIGILEIIKIEMVMLMNERDGE